MIILSIETSCDETAVSIVEATGDFPDATYTILGNALFSQIDLHREYGGVFPALAKREHAKTLVPMLERALEEAKLLQVHAITLPRADSATLSEILYREPGLSDALIAFLEKNERPDVDVIAVTSGPGLEPALWVGINFARALSFAWNIPVVPVNHMEGHILSSLFTENAIPRITFPALALLISGGHTELVLMDNWQSYKKIGETRDDAVGEAFDKVARMLGLQYPGGPEISSRARRAREENLPSFVKLPRPMLDSDDLDFSFSGLKTAVRYAIEDKVNAEGREGALGYKVNAEGREGALGYKVNAEGREGALGYRVLSEQDIASIACEFENAVTEVLLKKALQAIETHDIQTLVVGGGVSANTYIRESFMTHFRESYPSLAIYFPEKNLSTDNSVMIALAGHARALTALPYTELDELSADGNLSLTVT